MMLDVGQHVDEARGDGLAFDIDFLPSVESALGTYVVNIIAIEGNFARVAWLTGSVVDHTVVEYEVVDHALLCTE